MFKIKPKEEKKLTKEQEEKLETAKEKKDIQNFIMDWIKLMAHAGFDNELDETFSLTKIVKEPYGFSCHINIVPKLSFAMLENEANVSMIQDNMGCIFYTKRIPKAKYMEAKFIMEDIPEINYEPYKSKDKDKLEPWELYLGVSIDGAPVIVSMTKYPHLIDQGATNMGKTGMINCICTNLIVQNDSSDLSMYFIQVDKSDQVIFRKCKHTRAYADDIKKALAVTNYLKEVVNARDKTLRPLIEEGICDNINGFNKVYKKYKQHKFTYVYLVIDEYSSLMPGDSDNKSIKSIKNAIQDNMERLVQIGRYVGIYVIIGLQRGTVDKLPSFVKAMCNTVATFRTNNERSSYVAIDSNEAVSLSPREFIAKTNEKVMGKTLTITPAMMLEYTKNLRWSNGQYHDFQYNSWLPKELQDKNETPAAPATSKNQKRKQERYANKAAIEELDDVVSKAPKEVI
jgi:hypothetical protein